MTERIVYARAHPEKIKLTERYYYTQEISHNSKVEPGREPEGKIEVVVPYDGYKYFTRHAGNDVELQLDEDPVPDHVDAQIGHLLLSDYGRTDLGQSLDLDDRWGSVPLCVPVVSSEIDRAELLHEDRHSCKITYEYQPSQPQVTALGMSIETSDEEGSGLQNIDGFNHKENQQLDDLFKAISGQINRRRILRLKITVELTIPSAYLPKDKQRKLPKIVVSKDKQKKLPKILMLTDGKKLPKIIMLKDRKKKFPKLAMPKGGEPPKIKRIALVWPTITSMQSLELTIYRYRLAPADTVIYNPEKGQIEWSNIPMYKRRKASASSLSTYSSPPMLLQIKQPSELYEKKQVKRAD